MSARFCSVLGLLAASGAISLTGCSHNANSTVVWEDNGMPSHNPMSQNKRWKYKFVYFPGEDVYYEPYTQKYFWFDGDFWYEGDQLPKHITINSVEPQVVRLAFDKPYMSHGSVVSQFAGYKTMKPGATDVSFFGEFRPVGLTDSSQDWTVADYAGMCGGEQFMANPMNPYMCCPGDSPAATTGDIAGGSQDSTTTTTGTTRSGMTTMAEPGIED